VFTPTTRRNCRQLVANSCSHRRSRRDKTVSSCRRGRCVLGISDYRGSNSGNTALRYASRGKNSWARTRGAQLSAGYTVNTYIAVQSAVLRSHDVWFSQHAGFLLLLQKTYRLVCLSVCHGQTSNRFFFFVSRWNRAILLAFISSCGTLQNVVIRYFFDLGP